MTGLVVLESLIRLRLRRTGQVLSYYVVRSHVQQKKKELYKDNIAASL